MSDILSEMSAQIAALKEQSTRDAIAEELHDYKFCNARSHQDLAELVRQQLDSDLCGAGGKTIAEVVRKEYLARPQLHPVVKNSPPAQPVEPQTSDLRPKTSGYRAFDMQDIRHGMSAKDRERARREILEALKNT
jgi:hypothetical protein